MSKSSHPGKELLNNLNEKEISQSDFAIQLGIPLSLLNNYIKGNRNFNVDFALSLEAVGIGKAKDWMEKQMEYLIQHGKNEDSYELKKKWKRISESAPISFFSKMDITENKIKPDIKKVLEIYNVDTIDALKETVDSYPLDYFRKSSAFQERKINIVGWSILAKYLAKGKKLKKNFKKENEDSICKELNQCFYKGNNVEEKAKEILTNYGIKFFTLDRPSKTPVDGMSFNSGKNPAIVLTKRYKRLDNFAFTLMHELGHVFLHLQDEKYNDANFFTNNSKNSIVEMEADHYGSNKLIKPEDWDKFYLDNQMNFSDDVIYKFSKEVKVHPGIIRGRVCFEHPRYYRKRTTITELNKLD